MPSFPTTPQQLIDIMTSTKCLVIKFSASWCGPCKNKTFLEAYHNLTDQYLSNSNVLFIEFDVDDDEQVVNETKLYNFNISSIPTIKIFEQGKELNGYLGAGNLDKVKSDIETILAH
jgi:thioredoxin-like negative regulator of GroEL